MSSSAEEQHRGEPSPRESAPRARETIGQVSSHSRGHKGWKVHGVGVGIGEGKANKFAAVEVPRVGRGMGQGAGRHREVETMSPEGRAGTLPSPAWAHGLLLPLTDCDTSGCFAFLGCGLLSNKSRILYSRCKNELPCVWPQDRAGDRANAPCAYYRHHP